MFAPPGFESLGRVPLLLLLHGVYGCQWNWWLNGDVDSVATEMLRDGKMLPMMIAMPSDGLWGDGSGYVPHAHADYEKWIVDDIPRCLRELFPQLHPGKFFIAGLSMGGYGALRLGMKYASRVREFPLIRRSHRSRNCHSSSHFPLRHFSMRANWIRTCCTGRK